MRKFTLKSLLAVAFTLLGSNFALADSWSINFVGLVSKDNAITISEKVVTISKTDMGTCSYGDPAVAIDSKFVLQTTTTWLMRPGGLYSQNSGARAFGILNCTKDQIITINATMDPSPTTNVTLTNTNGDTYTYRVNADGDVKFTPARYIWINSITVEDPAAGVVDYTVKYVDEDNNEIKTATIYSEAPGTDITLSDNDKKNIVYEGKTYIYKSDDSEGKTVAADGSTVVTITFRKSADYTYTAKEVFGENVFRSTNGTGDEGTTVKVPYRRYNYDLVTGVLYKKDATNKEYNYELTLDQDEKEANIEYTATDVTDVVFLSEGEDIDGMTICSGNNAVNSKTRSSNSAAAYAASDVKITSLNPGTYMIHVGIFDANSKPNSTWVFKAGDNEVANLNCTVVNLQELESSEFTITETTDLYMVAGGSDKMGLDFIYIVKTGDAPTPVNVTIGSTGYATLYYGDRALEVPEGVKAFTYTMTGNTLKENTTYEAGDVIPAGEAVVLNGTAGNYTFNLGTATAEKDAQNVLKGSDVEATFNEAGHKYYMLSTNAAGEVGFYWYNDDGSAINCAAHKAYLDVNITSAKNGYLIDGTEDPTAITAATAEENGTNVVYDLQGRRVMNPTKGLYIVNGKKVIK